MFLVLALGFVCAQLLCCKPFPPKSWANSGHHFHYLQLFAEMGWPILDHVVSFCSYVWCPKTCWSLVDDGSQVDNHHAVDTSRDALCPDRIYFWCWDVQTRRAQRRLPLWCWNFCWRRNKDAHRDRAGHGWAPRSLDCQCCEAVGEKMKQKNSSSTLVIKLFCGWSQQFVLIMCKVRFWCSPFYYS